MREPANDAPDDSGEALEVVYPGVEPRLIAVCERIADGALVRKVAPELGFSRPSVYRWSESSPTARALYARARVWQAHSWAEKAMEIAEDAQYLDSSEKVAAARLRVDTIKWFTSKLAPKIYGELMEVAPTTVVNAVVMLPPKVDRQSYAQLPAADAEVVDK